MNSSSENTIGLPVRPGVVLGKRYSVARVLGVGGCGVVFLARDLTTKRFVALKTFRDEFVTDPQRRRAFEREALLWLMLGRHRSIVEVTGVEYIQGRLFIVMEYIQSGADGRVSLFDYLKDSSRRLAKEQVTKWAIEFCLGMEYANSHGLQSHGDIKPGNILVTPQGDLKIADFGLARASQSPGSARACSSGGEVNPAARQHAAELWSCGSRSICGTVGYIAPEVLEGQAADVRSDIFSFGVVLYQMTTHRFLPPFLSKDDSSVSDFTGEDPSDMTCSCLRKLGSSLRPIIERCLQPDPAARFGSFAELRRALQAVHSQNSVCGCLLDEAPITGPDELMAQGASLLTLDRPDLAAECFREAVGLAPCHAPAWVGLAEAAMRLGRTEEARRYSNRAIRLNLRCGAAWRTKGLLHDKRGFGRIALRCYQKAVALDPDDVRAWLAISGVLLKLGLVDEGRKCLEETLAKDLKNAAAWEHRGLFQTAQGEFLAAIESYKFALIIDPQCETALVNKGIALDGLNRHQEAIACYDDALKINPRSTTALTNQAASWAALGYLNRAIANCHRALELQESLSHAWLVEGLCLMQLRRKDDALDCLIRATKLDAREPSAWLSRGDAEATLGMFDAAETSWRQVLEVNASRNPKLGEQIQQRLEKLRATRSNGFPPVAPGLQANQPVWHPAEPKIRPPLPRARVTTTDKRSAAGSLVRSAALEAIIGNG